MLPLWRRVIFVDWQGVLSRDPFWMSILANPKHPLRPSLEAELARIFSRDAATSHEWMKGILSSTEIISGMKIRLDRRFRDDFLHRRLDDDCRYMKINVELLEALRRVRGQAFVVIATDNMDCFVRAFDYARSRARRSKKARETLNNWAAFCDDIVCSSEVGQLKSEDPVGFFGPWLSAYGLRFSDALLIDDRADNCAAFVQQGGAVIQWKMGAGEISQITESLDGWFQRPGADRSDALPTLNRSDTAPKL